MQNKNASRTAHTHIKAHTHTTHAYSGAETESNESEKIYPTVWWRFKRQSGAAQRTSFLLFEYPSHGQGCHVFGN